MLLLVGFTEGLATRGLLLVGLRSRLSEVWVWFLTSALFGLMHLVNALIGQAVGPTLQQVALAFGAGTVFYILRRVTGSLIWAMVLHGLWDFSTFSASHGTPGPLVVLGGIVEIGAIVIAFIGVAFVIRGADERIGTGKASRGLKGCGGRLRLAALAQLLFGVPEELPGEISAVLGSLTSESTSLLVNFREIQTDPSRAALSSGALGKAVRKNGQRPGHLSASPKCRDSRKHSSWRVRTLAK